MRTVGGDGEGRTVELCGYPHSGRSGQDIPALVVPGQSEMDQTWFPPLSAPCCLMLRMLVSGPCMLGAQPTVLGP